MYICMYEATFLRKLLLRARAAISLFSNLLLSTNFRGSGLCIRNNCTGFGINGTVAAAAAAAGGGLGLGLDSLSFKKKSLLTGRSYSNHRSSSDDSKK